MSDMRFVALLSLLFLPFSLTAQWEPQDSSTKQDLYSVSAPTAGIAWASGTHGTVVRTVDGGHTWQPCAAPQGEAKLEFRAVQATDAMTAVLMSSGKGEASALYRMDV